MYFFKYFYVKSGLLRFSLYKILPCNLINYEPKRKQQQEKRMRLQTNNNIIKASQQKKGLSVFLPLMVPKILRTNHNEVSAPTVPHTKSMAEQISDM